MPCSKHALGRDLSQLQGDPELEAGDRLFQELTEPQLRGAIAAVLMPVQADLEFRYGKRELQGLESISLDVHLRHPLWQRH